MPADRFRIFIVRHPPVAVEKTYCYGAEDVAPVEPFDDWINHLKEHVPDWTSCRILSSPLQRCRRPIETLIGKPVDTDANLKEMNLGDWEGNHWQDLPREEIDHWNKDLHKHAAPGGESGEQLQARCRLVLDRIAENGGDHLLITHGGWIRAALAEAMGTTLAHTVRVRIDYGGVTRLTRYEAWTRIDFINR